MSVTNFIRKCLDVGMPLDMALSAAEAFESEIALLPPAKSKGAMRTERYRQRKASQSSPSDASDERKSPEPPKKTTPIPPLKGGTFPEPSASFGEKPKAEPAEKLSLWVDRIWEGSPSRARERSGKRDLARSLEGAVRRGHAPAAVAAALDAYFATKDATKNDGEFVKGVHRMVEADRWLAFAVEHDPHPPPDSDPWPGRLREFQRNGFWNTTDWGPKPGKSGCLAPEGLLERAA